MRKAQSISLNTIVIAAIALIVLIVLVVIFVSRSREFVETSNECEAVSGTCAYDSCTEEGMVPHPTARCPGEPDIRNPCCIEIPINTE